MANMIFRRGARTFTAASALVVVVAVLHLGGLSSEPANDQWGAAMDAMREASAELGPLTMNFYDVLVGVWIQVSVLLVLLAVKNFLVLATVSAEALPRLIRVLSFADALVYAALAALFLYYEIPPPLVSFALLAVVFFAAALLAGRAQDTRRN